MEGTTAVDGGELMGINPNMGDKVKIPMLPPSTKDTRLTRYYRLHIPTTASQKLNARPMRAATRLTATVSRRRPAYARGV